MASSFIETIVPSFQKYGAQYGFHIISFAIAQACFESGYGTSNLAVYSNNILGICSGSGWASYSSWDACVNGYYTNTVLGTMDQARNATTLDEYYSAFVASNYCPGTEASYYSSIKSIINENNLTQYDATNGQSLSSSTTNVLQDFLNIADEHSNGESFYDWVQGVLGLSGYEAWCADFVCACAKEAGVLNKLIAQVAWVDGLLDTTASEYGGTIHLHSSGYTPQPGDLVAFKTAGEQYGYHVGIVNKVEGNTLYTFEGNSTGSRSAKCQYSMNYSDLYRYCHPNWSSMGGYSSGSSGGGALYQTAYTRADAIIREVAYIDSNFERSIAKSGIHLSVLNYTTMLADLWRIYGYDTGTSSESSSDTSGLSGSVKTVVDYLIGKGLNAAAACGVAANIFYESSFDTAAVGDGGTSFGICQWHEGRGTNMKNYVGSDWSTNLTGQLDYLWYELNQSYQGTLNHLKSVTNTEEGAKSAADYFVRNFEVPANVDSESVKRQTKAAEYFSSISTGGTVNDGTLTDKQRAVINAANVVGSPGAGLCAAWVTNVFSYAGIGSFYGNACDLYDYYCTSQNKSYLKPGMIIAVDSHMGTDAGYIYGHVGIYVGDGEVMQNVGPITTVSLDSWIESFETREGHPAKWGWMGNVNLTT